MTGLGRLGPVTVAALHRESLIKKSLNYWIQR
jgi:hypothetical protein